MMTLKNGVEVAIKKAVPEVKKVVEISQSLFIYCFIRKPLI